MQNTLPDDYDYQVQSFTDDGEDSVDSFHAAIRIALTTPEEAAAWLTAYETHNKCTLRILAKPQVKGKKVLFKCCYRLVIADIIIDNPLYIDNHTVFYYYYLLEMS